MRQRQKAPIGWSFRLIFVAAACAWYREPTLWSVIQKDVAGTFSASKPGP